MFVVSDDGNWTLDFLGGYAPVQAFGEIAGKPFYFRARYDYWKLVIADEDAVGAFCGFTPALFERSEHYGEADGFDASYMNSGIALRFIHQSLLDYQANCNNLVAVGQ